MMPKLDDYEVRSGRVTDIDCPNCGAEKLMRYNGGVSCRSCKEMVEVETDPYVALKDATGNVFKEMSVPNFRRKYNYAARPSL